MHWRNYEAGYDVAELEPPSRDAPHLRAAGVLRARSGASTSSCRGWRRSCSRHRVNVAQRLDPPRAARPGLAARLGARARRSPSSCTTSSARARTRESRVGVWTRELIDAALAVGGTYYLPYQPHATAEQFHRAYPRARELFALKRRARSRLPLPQRALGQVLRAWLDRSQARAPRSSIRASSIGSSATSDLSRRASIGSCRTSIALYPEDRFHTLIQRRLRSASRRRGHLSLRCSSELPGIKPFLADLRYALPSLAKQKREMVRQTLELLGPRRRFDGYVEIGIDRPLRQRSLREAAATCEGACHFVDDVRAAASRRSTSSSAAASRKHRQLRAAAGLRADRRRRRSPTGASTW